MTAHELLDRLRSRAEEFRRLDAHVSGAKLIDEILTELEPVVNGEQSEALTIAQAATRSGYTADHIGRLVRSGKLANVGKPGAPRVRASDLPRKPAAQVAAVPIAPYNPNSDARFIRLAGGKERSNGS